VGLSAARRALAACLLAAAPLAAAGAPVQGEERARALAALQEAQRAVTTLRASVVQRKRHPLLKAEVVQEGRLLLERPRRLRWEVLRPERLTVVVDGPSLLVYRPDRQEVQRRNLAEDLTGRAMMEFLVAGMRLDLAEMEKRFALALDREPGGLRLTLTPRSGWLARGVTAIEIRQAEADPVPRRLVITGPRGQRTETRLDDLEINPRLPEDAFVLRLGPEVRWVDVRRAPDAGGSQR
jgi:outer membrane lipoprotein-sorting protein